jgi:hypothetical protein
VRDEPDPHETLPGGSARRNAAGAPGETNGNHFSLLQGKKQGSEKTMGPFGRTNDRTGMSTKRHPLPAPPVWNNRNPFPCCRENSREARKCEEQIRVVNDTDGM